MVQSPDMAVFDTRIEIGARKQDIGLRQRYIIIFNAKVTAPATRTLSSSRAEEGQDGTPCTISGGRERCGI
jgi:hypothetical protein